MFEVKTGTPPTKAAGMTAALRKLPGGDKFVELPLGDNPRARRASLYQTAKRLGIAITVHNTGTTFQVWRTR